MYFSIFDTKVLVYKHVKAWHYFILQQNNKKWVWATDCVGLTPTPFDTDSLWLVINIIVIIHFVSPKIPAISIVTNI